MLDFKLTEDGDLELSETGDIAVTNSVCQAVRVRLKWFFGEWRLSPEMGFPYFEEVFVKNPNQAKIKYLVRKEVAGVEEVTDVKDIQITVDKKTRTATIAVTFCTEEDTFTEEVNIGWKHTD